MTDILKPTREVLSTRHIWYDWRQPEHNFLLMKNSQWSRKIENGGNFIQKLDLKLDVHARKFIAVHSLE